MDVNNSKNKNELNGEQQRRKKKGHGNRRNQRFRRKCRARGMKPKTIEKLMKRRKQINNRETNQTNTTDGMMATTASSTTHVQTRKDDQTRQVKTTTNLNKRKRNVSMQELRANSTIPKSTSTISITAPVSKKMRKTGNKRRMTTAINENNTNVSKNYRFVLLYFLSIHVLIIELFFIYRRPMYLNRSPSILFKMIRNRLNYSLKKKNEQPFVHTRLGLFDQRYYLELHQQLWQCYFDIGLQQHVWPVSCVFVQFIHTLYFLI